MKPLFFSTLKGLIAFALSAALLLFILTFIALRLEDPAETVLIFSNAALLLSAFIGGRFSANTETRRIISGLTLGAVAIAAVLILSLILIGPRDGMLLRVILTVLLSTLGALSKRSGQRTPSSAKKRKSIVKKYGAYR